MFAIVINADPVSLTSKPSESHLAQIIATLLAFILTILTFLRAITSRVTKKLPESTSQPETNYATFQFDSVPKEEFRPPSPAPGFTQVDLLSSLLSRLGELEEKVEILQAKQHEMPSEKEELLNAAVRRVDALEAELIVTKKVKLCNSFPFLTNVGFVCLARLCRCTITINYRRAS